ncbi:brain-specific angiogenesis inhibitor 1-associated protein 2-like protein 1b [Festucalex cinctus]
MSRSAEEVNKLTESTYKNVMDQFNPGLRNLVNLGKNYEKSVAAMTLAGRLYFDAMAKIGESAVVSPVSRELGMVLMGISEVHRKVFFEWEDNLKRFHREIISELERKTDMDVKYMTATFKRYQMEHKMKQDSLEKSQADLKKLRRKSQGKNATKYENKESECVETLTTRQMDMQLFIADGCKEALLEEKRRFCFLVDKHCMFSYQIASFHDKAKDILMEKLTSWQDQCNDATDMPESVMTMIEGLRTPISITPMPSPTPSRHSLNISAPPAPSQRAHVSPLVNMFTPDNKTPSITTSSNNNTDPKSNGENNLARSISVATGLNHVVKRPRVRTIFPHTAGNNNTLLSFDEGDVIFLLIPEEKDGWMYGEMEKNGKRGWFPSSYCRAFSEPLENNNSLSVAPYRSRSVVNLHHQDTETDEATMILPPEDYADNPRRAAVKTHHPSSTNVSANNHRQHSPTPSAVSSSSSSDHHATNQTNGISRPAPAYLAGGNPFSTVRLRPTVTNDRSAPVI